jgi:hypothetical protein
MTMTYTDGPVDMGGNLFPPDVSKPNVPLLRKVLTHIEEHPDEHHQAQWAVRTGCGTAYCFAGWAAVMSGAELDWDRSGVDAQGRPVTGRCEVDGQRRYIEVYAKDQLGLSYDDANDLFAWGNSREMLREVAERIAGEPL